MSQNSTILPRITAAGSGPCADAEELLEPSCTAQTLNLPLIVYYYLMMGYFESLLSSLTA